MKKIIATAFLMAVASASSAFAGDKISQAGVNNVHQTSKDGVFGCKNRNFTYMKPEQKTFEVKTVKGANGKRGG